MLSFLPWLFVGLGWAFRVWLSLYVGFGEGFLFLPWLFVGLGWVFRVWLSLYVDFGEGFLFLPWLFVGLGWARMKNCAKNFTTLRRMALALLKSDPNHPKVSIQLRRKLAAMDFDYLLNLVGIKEN